MNNWKNSILYLFCGSVIIFITVTANYSQGKITTKNESNLISPNVVISEVYGGSGTNNAYQADFVELLNIGTSPVNLNGWSVQYFTQAATTSSNIVALPNFNLQPGQYFLIQMNTASTGGTALPLPMPDLVSPSSVNLNATQGKILLASVTTSFSTPCPASQTNNIVDKVGYGTTATICNETSNTSSPSSTTSATRLSETDDNSVDFTIVAPTPQNSLAPTAASAQVSGRVVDSNGNGISRVQVKISGGELSEPVYAITSPFGYYNFEVPAGQTYIVSVSSKNYTFSNPTRVINVNDNITDLNFTADVP